MNNGATISIFIKYVSIITSLEKWRSKEIGYAYKNICEEDL